MSHKWWVERDWVMVVLPLSNIQIMLLDYIHAQKKKKKPF